MKSLALLFMGLLFLTGCCQVAESITGEMGTCLEKCSELCGLAKDNDFNFEGFNQIKLTKEAGSASFYCECPCY